MGERWYWSDLQRLSSTSAVTPKGEIRSGSLGAGWAARGGGRCGREDGAGGGWKGTSAGEGPRGVALGGEVLDAVVFIDLECDVLLLLVPQDDDLHGLALIGTQGALPVRGGVDAV